jgi:peptide/nickel transport system substrate-binding protein
MTKATTVEKTGEWEVTIKTPVDYLTSYYWIVQGGGFNAVLPPEVIQKYGDVADWRNTVGTGPFMLTDYVKGSSLTFIKNPDYWETDPVGPGKGNKLPYIDQYRLLIIPDVSTRLAALRTAKIDMLPDATKEDAQTILKENPKMSYVKYLTNGFSNNATFAIAGRTDKKDTPFADKRVRQAMMLATDFNGLKQTLFGGEAEIDVYPVNSQLISLYKPLSELPQSVQDLFKYNPEKAKQLLKDAGYANGFKATVAVQNDPQLTDELSVYKDMWSKVGIDLTIDPKEAAAFVALQNARSYDDLIYRSQVTFMPVVLYFSPYRGKSTNNPSFINDPEGSVPEIENIFKEVNDNVFTDWTKTYDAYKRMKSTLLENAYVIPRPTPYVYSMWWPWVKNYYGTTQQNFIRYSWVDQDLKKSMGH